MCLSFIGNIIILNNLCRYSHCCTSIRNVLQYNWTSAYFYIISYFNIPYDAWISPYKWIFSYFRVSLNKINKYRYFLIRCFANIGYLSIPVSFPLLPNVTLWKMVHPDPITQYSPITKPEAWSNNIPPPI
jgi:hypothetical protein